MASSTDHFGKLIPPSPQELDAALPGYEVTEVLACGGRGRRFRHPGAAAGLVQPPHASARRALPGLQHSSRGSCCAKRTD